MCINLSQLSLFAHLNLFVCFPCYQVAGWKWFSMDWRANKNRIDNALDTQGKTCTSQCANKGNMCRCASAFWKKKQKRWTLYCLFYLSIFEYCQVNNFLGFFFSSSSPFCFARRCDCDTGFMLLSAMGTMIGISDVSISFYIVNCSMNRLLCR